MKIIKNDWRNRLATEGLTDLMRIKLESAEVGEFIPDPAIDLWLLKSLKGRRLHQRRWAMKKSSGEEGEEDLEETEQVSGDEEQGDGRGEGEEEVCSDGFSTELSSCESSGEECLDDDYDDDENNKCE